MDLCGAGIDGLSSAPMMSAGDIRPNRASKSESNRFCGSGRIVAYQDRTAFFGDYFRIGGDSPGRFRKLRPEDSEN